MLRNLKLLTRNRNVQQFRSITFGDESKDDKQWKKEIEESKKSLKWRETFDEKTDEWYSKFKVFGNSEQNSDMITMLQQPIDLSPQAIKKWWKKRAEKRERFMQQYITERHEILGSDLAASHFIVYRGGAVKFLHDPRWVRADENSEYQLPRKYNPTYLVEAIRCDNMLLYYEGLENIRNLKYLKFWSFRNVKTFDDWCLDRISGAQNDSLEVLDISGTNITERGLSCLYRIQSLKLLIVDDPKLTQPFELSCALLEDCLPKLKIVAAEGIHDI